MMSEQDWSTQKVVAAIAGIGAIALLPGALLLSAEAQTTYPDVPTDYWAQPYIMQLSEADILTGYPDGTFRPQQAIDRDEYAAVIRQAFDAEPVKAIPQASTFEDVPEGYWANDAIEEAYEGGFLGTPAPDQFAPKTDITRANAIVALVEGLGSEQLLANAPTVVAVPAAAEPVQPVRRQKASNPLMFPLAATTVMQLFAPSAQAASPAQAAPPSAQADGTNPDAGAQVPLDLSEYYDDADQIPEYARDEVAIATESGLIVNYPDPNLLNPNQPITRGETASFIYQVLENRGELEPLPAGSDLSKYVVTPKP